MFQTCRYGQRALFKSIWNYEIAASISALVVVWLRGVPAEIQIAVIGFVLIRIISLCFALYTLKRAPRAFSKRDKQRLLEFLALHRLDFNFPMRLTVVPLHDEKFAKEVAEVFDEGGWCVEITNCLSIPPSQQEGIWVSGHGKCLKGLEAVA